MCPHVWPAGPHHGDGDMLHIAMICKFISPKESGILGFMKAEPMQMRKSS